MKVQSPGNSPRGSFLGEGRVLLHAARERQEREMKVTPIRDQGGEGGGKVASKRKLSSC